MSELSFKYKFLAGDSKDALKQIANNTFHMAVTSPPYWAQRDYKVAGQLGQEETVEEYVENLVSICREVRRVLREDGTFWLNIGDGYCKKRMKQYKLKQGDLLGVPWKVAFALRDDGWYLRSDIIWHKSNPQPESQRTRPSKSHEHLFLFAKSEKYFYDAEAIAVPQKEISVRRAFSKNNVKERKDHQDDNYAISGKSQDKTYEKMRKMIEDLGPDEVPTCNKRDVWELATANNKIKHFAMYPEELVEPCILAGTSLKGCCPKCKTQWIRTKKDKKKWRPDCTCGESDTQACLVLDPFNGSGTTGRVCLKHDRKYVGVDISDEYLKYARDTFIELNPMIPEESEISDIIE
jgi:DNA modification methylase